MKNEAKIPRIIHYCWFGKSEKPDIVKQCIKSWRNLLHGYQIIEWNEENFDINSNVFVKEAYENKKYAFVSDYVRAYILYKYGGIYLDTDVEVYKSFDNFLHHETFWGFEQENYIATSTIGSIKGSNLIKTLLDSYKSIAFVKENGDFNDITNVSIITEVLEGKGLLLNGEYQVIHGVGTFYPQTFFSPYDYINCRMFKTENTYAIHHFYKSWLPPKVKIKSQFKKLLSKVIGGENIAKIRKISIKTGKIR